jgi:FkbM family methyltransferase
MVLREPGRYARLALIDAPRAWVYRWLGSTVSLDGVKVRLGPHCSMTVALEIVAGHYELPERTLLKDALEHDDVVLELGAGVGVVSAICAQRLGSSRVHAFEANPNLIPLANDTYNLNGVAPSIENSILANAEGEQKFYLERDFWSSSTVKRSSDAIEVSVPVRRLVGEIERIRPTFLIVDIEGGEAEIFQDASLPHVKKVLIELHPHVVGAAAIARVRRAFAAAGFSPAREMASGNQVYYVRKTPPRELSLGILDHTGIAGLSAKG